MQQRVINVEDVVGRGTKSVLTQGVFNVAGVGQGCATERNNSGKFEKIFKNSSERKKDKVRKRRANMVQDVLDVCRTCNNGC